MPDTTIRVRLTRISGAKTGETIELGGGAAVRIGSSPFSDVKFGPDEAAHVATVHAKIVFSQGTHWLYDNEGDEVATLVNGENVTRVALKTGDVLQFGEKGPRLRFELVGEKPATPAVPTTPAAEFHAELTQQLDPSVMTPRSAPDEPEEESNLDKTIQLAPNKKTAAQIPALALRQSTDHPLEAATITIGRQRGNDIVLDHPQISSLHAQIQLENGRHVLVDRKSANGTFVGTDRISKKVLAPDDLIHIGPYTLVYLGKKLRVYGEQSASTIDIVHVTKEVAGGLKLLDDVTLRIDAGELVGLIGPSGAGKSTLLGVLNGLRRATHGRVLVNGIDLVQNYDSLKSFMGFVPQDYIIHTELTPDRTLHYVSLLRLPSDSTRAERTKRIDEVVQLLELQERRKIPIHRLSGGQRKRVSIGVELMTEPQLIFLDEPTAGLDPALESKMMVLFKELASRGKTVLVTTHLMENVHLFDKLLIMMKGKLVFYGTPDETLKHFGISDVRHL
ncbi:MAG: ATP-binding cassette domain-containing protein, partial [Planctomycetota bacterium]